MDEETENASPRQQPSPDPQLSPPRRGSCTRKKNSKFANNDEKSSGERYKSSDKSDKSSDGNSEKSSCEGEESEKSSDESENEDASANWTPSQEEAKFFLDIFQEK